jgi:hypothetical protein
MLLGLGLASLVLVVVPGPETGQMHWEDRAIEFEMTTQK